MILANSDGNLHMAGAHHGGTFAVKMYSQLIRFRLWIQGLPLVVKLAVTSGIFLLPLLALSAIFINPVTTQLSYAGQNCFSNFMVLPNFANAQSSNTYSVSKTPALSLAGYPLVSNESCVNINSAPDKNVAETVKFTALGLLNKQIEINTPDLPKLTAKDDLTEPISPLAGLNFELDQPDETFAYMIGVNDQSVDCIIENSNVNCPLKDFGLDQGSVHEIKIAQVFNDYHETIVTENIKLRDPVIFADSSIKNEQIVYSAPTEITITANKNLDEAGDITLSSNDTDIPVSAEIQASTITIKLSQELPREAEFKLSIKDTEASDGAYLPEEFVINFSTSGGPKITSHNIDNYDVSAGKTFVLTFDSNISQTQDLNNFVSLKSGSSTIQANISAEANKIYISPTANLSACTNYSVQIAQGLANEHGVTGGTEWSHNFRTTCKQIFSIGTSVQGRSLTAYKFGSGPNRILFVGGMHGNERSSYQTLIAYVDELERRYNETPSDKSIVIIPDINPDGYAHQTRTNANGVDLNRNFPSNDWTTGIYMPGGVYLENGGGTAPLDQPESSALASYINSFSPRLVLTYHAVASTVISNGAGDSYSLADLYSEHSGFAHYTSAHEDGIFAYLTTGEFETWLADKKGIPALLVELATMSSNELYSQRSAMWATLGI